MRPTTEREQPAHADVPVVTRAGSEQVGTGRIWFGEDYGQWVELTEGDFVFVPPHMPHVEGNMSVSEDLVWLTCRTPDNIVVNLPEVDDAVLEGYRRR